MIKIPMTKSKHVVIEVWNGRIHMNEFTCNDLLRKVRESYDLEDYFTGHITYLDCKQILSDAEYLPNIDTRLNCILVRLFPVACVILRNSILVIANEFINLDPFIRKLCEVTGGGEAAWTDDNVRCSYEEFVGEGKEGPNFFQDGSEHSEDGKGYEAAVIECCYSVAVSHMEYDLAILEEKFKILEAMTKEKRKFKDISILLHELKSPVKRLGDIINGFDEVNNELLNREDDIKMLEFRNHHFAYARDQRNVKAQHLNRDLESLIQYFDQEVEQLSKRVRNLASALSDLEGYVTMELAISRNDIMRFELIFNILAVALTFSCCISGLFGMNVVNRLEQSRSTFIIITSISLLALVLSFFFISVLRHKLQV